MTIIIFVCIIIFTKPVRLNGDDMYNNFQVIHANDAKNNHNVRIIELIAERIKHRQFFYAIEVSAKPNFTLDYNVFKTMRNEPLFTSVTWHIDLEIIHNTSIDQVAPFQMFEQINQKHPTLLHLTCYSLSDANLDTILKRNVTNIFAIRGDSYRPEQPYQHAADLVEAIRNKASSNITIGVAAYPEKHPDAESFDADLLHLKQKVDAGADFIITQICFSAVKIINFINAARALNITVPIIPGIFIPRSYKHLEMVAKFISLEIPDEILTRLEPYKTNDSIGFRPAMKQIIAELINELKQHSEDSIDFRIPGVQLFTFNLANVVEVIEAAGL